MSGQFTLLSFDFDFPQGLLVLGLVHGQVMPFHFVLHEGDAAAFARPGDDHAGAGMVGVGVAVERQGDQRSVVAVDNVANQSKSAEFFVQGIEVGDFPRGAKSLQTIGIEDEGQIIQTVMGGEDKGFPIGAFVPFAVGEEAEDAAGLVTEFACQSDSRSEAQAVAEAAGGEGDVGDSLGRRMAAQAGGVFVELLEVFFTKAADRPEGDIQRPGGVALGQNEYILLRQNVVIKPQQQIEGR